MIYIWDRSYNSVPHVCCKLIWGLSILKVSRNFQTLGSINNTPVSVGKHVQFASISCTLQSWLVVAQLGNVPKRVYAEQEPR